MDILLKIHNINRWLFIIFGMYAITKAARGLIYNQPFGKRHNLSSVLFLAVAHLQLLLGLLLYLGKGWHTYLSKLGEHMSNSYIRFWTIEHMFGMVVAIILIQIGRTRAKKATESRKKYRITLTFFTVAMLIVLATIPWPFRVEIARPLLP